MLNMDPKEQLLFALIRHVKDAYIVSQLYALDEAYDQIEVLLEEAATKIVLWEKADRTGEGVDRG